MAAHRCGVMISAGVAILVACAAVLWTTPWTDEVFYVDPGACLAGGRGFISNGWSIWGGGVNWGLSNPGVPLLLSGWFKLFGFGQFQSHAFFLCAYVVGVFTILRWSEIRWVLSWADRAALLSLALLLHSLSGNMIYHARHDALSLLLFGWFLFLEFPPRPHGWTNYGSAICFGIACVALGLQFCGFFALAAAIIFLVHRNQAPLVTGLWIAAGYIIGFLLLRYAFDQLGVWRQFWDNRAENFGRVYHWGLFTQSKDLPILGFGCAVLFVQECLRRESRSQLSMAALAGLLLVLLGPLLIHSIGLYQSPFTWMVAVPLLLLMLPQVIKVRWLAGGWFVLLVGGLMGLALGQRLMTLADDILDKPRRAAACAALQHFAPVGEVVIGSMPIYYELRGSGREAYWTYDHRLPPVGRPKAAARWALVTERDAPLVRQAFGGEWQEVYADRSARDDRSYLLLHCVGR